MGNMNATVLSPLYLNWTGYLIRYYGYLTGQAIIFGLRGAADGVVMKGRALFRSSTWSGKRRIWRIFLEDK